jgi:signal transduction histidine kinase
LIVRSLLQNAQATLDVHSRPDEGMRVTIVLTASADGRK